ncbi:MAG: hypothetical protein AABZ61_01350, partial [Bacteroidota bacterium]
MLAQLGIFAIALLIEVPEPEPQWLNSFAELRPLWESAGEFIERTLSSFSGDNNCAQHQAASHSKNSWKIAVVDEKEPG